MTFPLPPIEIQNKIVHEFKGVDIEVSLSMEKISQSQMEMDRAVGTIYESEYLRIEVAELSLDIQYGLSEKMNENGIGFKIFRMNEIIQGRMVDNGTMKDIDITTEEFAKYRLNRGDLLFNRTNSIEHVGKTGLFDLEGDYCFASYLIRVVPDTNKVLPQFLVKMMNSPIFQAEAKGRASKSINQSNINATVMKSLKIPLPPINEQQKFVTKIEALECNIAEAQSIINAAPGKNEAIMKKYL